MKKIHRKIIALQARLGLKMAQDLARWVSVDQPKYKAIRGPNYDLVKAAQIGSAAKPSLLAKMVREVIRTDPPFTGKGNHTWGRLNARLFNNKKIFVRTLVGPFNEGFIETDHEGNWTITN